jgi:hypothetical protein
LGLALAQDAAPNEADPPDRAARLSYVQGEVSLQPAGEEEWASAIVNRPLTTGDKLWTDEGARAEIYVGPAAVRLGSDTGFSFLNVDDDTIQMRMTAGVMDVRVRDLDDNDHIEIDTPNLALSVLRPGRYRVEVNDEGDTTVVKVSEGEAEASGGSQDVVVHAQQAATFRGTEQLAAEMGSLGAPDDFDSWSLERDRRDQVAATSPAAQYVSPEVTGYEDLDANGSWSSEPEYGYVWTPRVVAVDWAPYRYGHWVWIAPWGWTWVDDAPWGFAPFHYGRWAHIRNRWCWVPGPRHVRPVYAPALVGWVGTPGVSVSVTVGGGGGVAWFPLGPREVYVPARRYSPRYVERVNVTNTVIVNKTYITNVYNKRVTNIDYRNRHVPGGVTAVSRTTFVSARPVGHHMERIDERAFARERATASAPNIQPVRESRVGIAAEGRRNMRPPPAAVVNRQVIAKREPPPAASRFVRTPSQSTFARDQADRLHRIQDRQQHGELNAGDQPAKGPASRGVDRQDRADVANGRDRQNRPDVADRRERPNGADAANAANGQNAANAAAQVERERAARDAAERSARAARDQDRPPQARMRAERQLRNGERPDHINRGPQRDDRSEATDAAAQAARQAQEENRARADQQAQNERREQMQRQLDQQREQNQRHAQDENRARMEQQAQNERRAQQDRQAQNDRREQMQRQMEQQRAQADQQRAQAEQQARENRARQQQQQQDQVRMAERQNREQRHEQSRPQQQQQPKQQQPQQQQQQSDQRQNHDRRGGDRNNRQF